MNTLYFTCSLCGKDISDTMYCDCAKPQLTNRTEAPEQILNRLAAKLGCEPRQVADRVIRMLEEQQK